MKKTFSILIRIAITVLLFAFIASKVDLRQVFSHIRNVPVYLFLLIFLWYAVTQFLGVYRWRILLDSQKISPSFWYLCVVSFKALFFNMILPTAMGGDVVRVYALYKSSSNRNMGVASVLVDRIIGLTAMVGIALFSILWGSRYLKETPFTVYILSFAVLYFFGVALLATSFLKKITQAVFRVINLKALAIRITNFVDALYSYLAFKKTVGIALVISFVVQIGVIFTYFFVARAMDIPVSLFHFFLFMPVVWVIAMLPVSLGGLGVREGAFIYLFSKVGIPKEACFSLSIVASGIAMLFNFLCGIFLLVPDKH